LPQESSVFRKLTVEDNIRAIAETLALTKAEQDKVVEVRLDELNLTHLAKQKAFTLSGGERRRLEITRALTLSPKFLLLDEPFSGVDPISVSEVTKIILDLKAKGIGIFVTDHNVRETLRAVDRAYLLYDGRVLAHGDANFLLSDPKTREKYLGADFEV
jgi:lipopolysaccharide export system ATP-binding protein